ncbi:MAG: WbqC family protein [Thauera sp.]
MKTVVVLQSNYIPWKGYFDLIHDADLFVFYDDLQYTKNDWRNRNRVKAVHGAEWITIPAGSDCNRLICEVELKDAGWQEKHWRTLQQNYGTCPHFARYRAFFEEVYRGRRWTMLSELNHFLIRHIAHEFLGITTAFADSRSFALGGQKQDRLLELLDRVGTQRYVSGPAASSYIEPERFAALGIALVWKDYAGYPEYPQRFPPFEHGVTILDLLFNVGPDAPWYIWGWRDGPLGS